MLRGILKTWNDEKGYGFIRPEMDDASCRDVFVHVSTFRGASRRPQVGDTILYQLDHGDPDKPRAVNAVIEGVAVGPGNGGNWTLEPLTPVADRPEVSRAAVRSRPTRAARPAQRPVRRGGRRRSNGIFGALALLVVLAGAGRELYRRHEPGAGAVLPLVSTPVVEEPVIPRAETPAQRGQVRHSQPVAKAPVVRQEKTPGFRCEGKNRCTQMGSCEEALFYLRNCPGSLTDGDGDGIPCEDQWCGH